MADKLAVSCSSIEFKLFGIDFLAEYGMFCHLLKDYVLKFQEHIPETTVVVTLLAKYSIDDRQEVLDDTIREKLYALEVQLPTLDMREANSYVLLLLLLVCHFLVLIVNLRGDAVLFQGINVIAYTK